MAGRACVAGGHAWQGVHGRVMCVAGGVHGRGVCMAGGHGTHASPTRYYKIQSMSGWYASYWIAFLFHIVLKASFLEIQANLYLVLFSSVRGKQHKCSFKTLSHLSFISIFGKVFVIKQPLGHIMWHRK